MIELIVFKPNEFCFKTLLAMSGEDAMKHGLDFEGTLFTVKYLDHPTQKDGRVKRIWYAVQSGLVISEEQVLKADKNLQ